MIGKFKIGDKVRIRKDLTMEIGSDGWYPSSDMLSLKGEVFEIVSITFDKAAYKLKLPIGYYSEFGWTDEMLESSDDFRNSTIRLTFNGRTTIARFKDKTGISVCNPEDVFDRNEGIRIAVERALGVKPKVETKSIEDYSLEELLKEVARRVQ